MNYPKSNYRTITNLALVILSAGIFLISCKKDSADDESISNEDIAEAVAQSMAPTSGGVVAQTDIAVDIAINKHLACGATKDSVITGQSLPGSAITFFYRHELNRTLNCSEGVPSSISLNYKGKTTYATLRMSSNDSAWAEGLLTGLQPSSTTLVLNQEYVRKGSQQSLVGRKRSFTSTITINSNDITVSKSTRKILSGTATVQFEGKTSGGISITRGGTITFEGNQKATLRLNNGGEYALSW